MSRQHLVAQVITELGEELAVPDLALDETSRATLSFENIHVTLHYVIEPIELLWLIVDLGTIDPSRTEVLEGLLQCGFLTWSSNCMTVGLDEQGDHGYGHASIPVVQLSLETLRSQLEEMVEAAQAIRERIERNDFEIALTP